MKKILILTCLLSAVFTGCKKSLVSDDDCPDPEVVTITSNSPVVEGTPLVLTAPDKVNYTYKWTGPNAFKIDTVYTPGAHIQGKATTVFADSGTYRVKIVGPDSCTAFEGAVFVKILPTGSQPCAVADNTSVSNLSGVGGMGYSPSFTGNEIEGQGVGEIIIFKFQATPLPGIYKTSGLTPVDDKTVGVYITNGSNNFISNNGQNVYVTKIGVKLQVGFCFHDFSNPLGTGALKISAKLAQQ